MTDRHTPPPLRQQLQAVLLAGLCSLLFLGEALRWDRALLPFPPELLQPGRDLALAQGAPPLAELLHGNLSMGDKYGQSLAWDRITRDRLRSAEIPRWNRDIAGGVPFVPQMAQVYQPWALLLLFVPAAGVYGIWFFLHQILFGFFAYRFLRRLRCSHLAAMFGLVAVALGLWTQSRVHHSVAVTSALPVFAMLSCVHHLMRCRGGPGHVALLALATGLCWLSGFAIISLQVSYLCVAYALFLALGNERGQRFYPLSRVAIAMALGLLLASAQLLPTFFAAAETSRLPATSEILAGKALEWDHLLSLFWPDLFDWPLDHFYGADCRTHAPWAALVLLNRLLVAPGLPNGAGFNFTETAMAFGLPALCLLPLSFRHESRRAQAWFFAAAGLCGLLLALAAPGFLQLTAVVPGARSGDLKRFLFTFSVCMPVLAALGYDRWLERGPGRPLLLGTAVFLCVSALLFFLHLAPSASLLEFYGTWAENTWGMGPGIMEDWVAGFPGEAEVNRSHLQLTFLRSSLVALVCLFLLLLRRRSWAARLFILVAILELVSICRGVTSCYSLPRIQTPPALLQPLLQATKQAEEQEQPRPRLQRLLGSGFSASITAFPLMPNLGAYYGLEDLGCYSPLPKSRMEELFGAIEPADKPGPGSSVALGGVGIGGFYRPESLSHPLLDLLGVEWILSTVPLDLAGLADRTAPGLPPTCRLYQRSGSLPRATFVGQALLLEDAKARLSRLGDRSHDPARVVVLEDPTAPMPKEVTGQAARLRFLYHRDEEVALQVSNTTPGYLRLADPFDHGWTASVNGTPTPVYIADHYFRAVYLEPGEHEIRFAHDAPRVLWPERLSLVGLLSVLVLGLFTWHRRRRQGCLS